MTTYFNNNYRTTQEFGDSAARSLLRVGKDRVTILEEEEPIVTEPAPGGR